MGNHDFIPYSEVYPSTKNSSWFPDYSILTIRGANSIDKQYRIEGKDWFPNEELTYQEGLIVFDNVLEYKPKIIISHDCPQSVMNSLFGYTEKSQTRNLLEAIFQEYKPELWVFGHHHQSKDVNILETRFICLNELEILKL